MRPREPQSRNSLADLSHDRQRRMRIKSPTLVRPKNAYLQNLEKKLDSLLTTSTNDQRMNQTSSFKILQTESSFNPKPTLSYDNHQVGVLLLIISN